MSTESPSDQAQRLIAGSGDGVHPIDNDAGTRNLINRLRTAEAALKHWESEKAEVKELLVKLAPAEAPRTAFTVNGYPVLKIEHRKSMRFDSTEFRTDHPDLYSRYRREVTSTYVIAAGEVTA